MTDTELAALAELAEMQTRCLKAVGIVGALCGGRQKWIMSIPARPDVDPDLIIKDALDDIVRVIEIILKVSASRSVDIHSAEGRIS